MARKKNETEQIVTPEEQVVLPQDSEELAVETPAVIAEEQAPAVAEGAVQFEEAPTEFDVEREMKKQKRQRIVKDVFVYIFLTLCAVLAFLPFYWMVISSVKTEEEYRASVPTFFPHTFMFKNYASVLSQADTNGSSFVQVLLNTLVVGLFSTVLGVVITIVTAYALARMEFKGKKILFAAMLATMMIPGELYTISNYVTVTAFDWENTFTVLIIPFLVSVYYIYLLRNNFMQIPNSLYQAAKVDGLSDMGYLIKVMVPLTAPTLISITLLKFIGTWNSYIWPRLINSSGWQMITNWVTRGFQDKDYGKGFLYPDPQNPATSQYSESLNSLKMAAVCMVSLPLFVLFIFCRKYIMRGVSKSGTKG